MRLYVKLILMTSAFAFLVSATGRRMTGNLAYEIRVALVCALGDEADFERLLEDTWRMRFAPIKPAHASQAGLHPRLLDDADDADDGRETPEDDGSDANADGGLQPLAHPEISTAMGERMLEAHQAAPFRPRQHGPESPGSLRVRGRFLER